MEYREKKKDLERKKMQKAEWPGGIEPALARHLGAGLYGPELSGHSDCSKPKLAYLYNTSSQSLTAKVLQVGFCSLKKLHNDKRQEV